jgi:polyisoprenoid-binding protein YceI
MFRYTFAINMKQIFFISALALMFSACNNHQATTAGDAQTVATDSMGTTYKADLTASIVNWSGTAVSHGHNGTINIKEGQLTVKDGNIASGAFVIDMNSIKCLDLTKAEDNGKLIGHLTSPDFFDTKAFAEGKFEIVSVAVLAGDTAGKTHTITGNLTLKGQAKSISFPAKVTISADEVSAAGTVIINRLDWGIKYKSLKGDASALDIAKWKDDSISDDMKIALVLKAIKG